MPTHNKLQEKASFKEGGTRRDKIMSYVVVFFYLERIATRASPISIPRDIYSTYVQA